jgi:hypothetical protein
MSNVKVQGNVSGSGTLTIAAPNTNTDRVLNLPDNSGTIQVSGSPISGTTGTFTGLLDISAAGAGQIQFPATQNASSNANTLDDYEEGTWAPNLRFNGGQSGNFTFSQNEGVYVKVGRLVHVQGWITWTGKPSAGDTLCIDLPFVSPSEQRFRGGINVTYADNPPFTGVTVYGWALRTEAGETRATINTINATSGGMTGSIGAANTSTAGSFMFSGTFVTTT